MLFFIFYFVALEITMKNIEPWRNIFLITLALFMSVGVADVSAQSFLKKLKQKVEAEVENRLELNKTVAAYEQIARVKIYHEEFEKTPKKCIKRFLYQEAR